ncbi:hypothetical protein F5877DRAFT_76128 [Lentinula edodes]|nr:hypothetical protein F5877DRAFT_76128 [Lentinula edodes]
MLRQIMPSLSNLRVFKLSLNTPHNHTKLWRADGTPRANTLAYMFYDDLFTLPLLRIFSFEELMYHVHVDRFLLRHPQLHSLHLQCSVFDLNPIPDIAMGGSLRLLTHFRGTLANVNAIIARWDHNLVSISVVGGPSSGDSVQCFRNNIERSLNLQSLDLQEEGGYIGDMLFGILASCNTVEALSIDFRCSITLQELWTEHVLRCMVLPNIRVLVIRIARADEQFEKHVFEHAMRSLMESGLVPNTVRSSCHRVSVLAQTVSKPLKCTKAHSARLLPKTMLFFFQRPSSSIYILACVYAFSTIRIADAQIPDFPSCANSCIQASLLATGCTTDDTSCLCTNSTFASAVLQCSAMICTADDQATVNSDLNSLCNIATSSSGLPGTSTGTFSETTSASSSAITTTESDTGVITLTTTLPGGSSVTVTATFTLSATPSPPISFTSSVPVIVPSTFSSATSSASGSVTSVLSSSVASVTSSPVPSLSSSSTSTSATRPVTTLTSTAGNGVSTAPAATTSNTSASSNSAAYPPSASRDAGAMVILTFFGTMAVLINMF